MLRSRNMCLPKQVVSHNLLPQALWYKDEKENGPEPSKGDKTSMQVTPHPGVFLWYLHTHSPAPHPTYPGQLLTIHVLSFIQNRSDSSYLLTRLPVLPHSVSLDCNKYLAWSVNSSYFLYENISVFLTWAAPASSQNSSLHVVVTPVVVEYLQSTT